MTKVAFMGFGEAAQAMARGLAKEGKVAGMTVYDVRFADGGAEELKQRAAESKVAVFPTVSEAVADADIVLSLVVGSAAVKVGEAAGQHMRAGQVFVDLNSISPEAKKRVSEALAKGGKADFVEGAVMSRVPPYEHKAPILLAGKSAEKTAETLNKLGMVCEAVGDSVGQACAVKMIRSVFVKGVEALLLESLTAAAKAGVTERILDSIYETFPGIEWRTMATYYLGRTQQHGARRQTEMNEAAATLESIGIEPMLSLAIARRIGEAHAKLKGSNVAFGSEYPVVLAALAEDAPALERASGAAG